MLYFIFIIKHKRFSSPTKKPIVIAASATIPPYVIEKTDSGIQLDIIKAALVEQGLVILWLFICRTNGLNNSCIVEVDILLNYAGELGTGIYS
ncbi:hypothetical protein ACOBV9_20280 (plasmid) [Pseudoalteromonas espejiana]